MKHFGISIIAAIAIASLCSGCLKYEKKANSSTTGTTTIACDNTFENIMAQEIDVFEYQNRDAHVLATYAPQSVVLDSLLSLNTRTVVLPRDITPEEKKFLKSKRRNARSMKIAVDAVALIVNNDNPVEKLTLGEVADIMAGRTTVWTDLQPNAPKGEISVIFDDKGSSLVSYMRDSLLNGAEPGPNVYAQGSIPAVFKTVKENVNAIGVLGVSWITTDMGNADLTQEELAREVLSDTIVQGASLSDDIKVLKIYRNDEARAYKPYQQNIFDGTYPMFRQIYLITTGNPGSLASGFYSFVTGNVGQKIILKTGILPARTSIQVVQLGE